MSAMETACKYADTGGIRDTRPTSISRVKLCLLMAVGCQLLETATSVGRRFWGSSQASEALITSRYPLSGPGRNQPDVLSNRRLVSTAGAEKPCKSWPFARRRGAQMGVLWSQD